MNEPMVELVYDRACPNVEQTRAMIVAAFREVGAEVRWTEWDREDGSTPAALRSYGSPTVLVNGRDIGGADGDDSRAGANSCRIYADECGCVCGIPSATLIVSALREAKAR